ncbi:MAG TPA: DUF4350 domain-containing protein [Kofleriaceae bacterium]|jgi:hypothetical protein|nr:DUF4350 domain-containing protein [Kofleriaceae bacterium]
MLGALVLAGLAARDAGPARAAPPPLALETDDYDPHSTAWNGMASFVGLAEGMGFEVTPVSLLEWSELSSTDILFLIYPLQHVDPGRLGAFVQAGGNVVIADDFGEGKDAMQGLGLLRAETETPRASKYYDGRSYAPIAKARGDHPLAVDVDEVITNHPAALTRIQGATTVVAFDEGAVVVAGERGSGHFVAISDPSIFINKMLMFRGNIQLAANLLRYLDRGGRARHVVLLRGDVPMYGDPRPYIDDAKAGQLGRSIADLNFWLSERRAWLLTPPAMKVLAAALAAALLLLAMVALPVRRGPRIDGAWLRFGRPGRRDEPHAVIAAAEAGPGSNLVVACVLRDHVQRLLTEAVGRPDPLYALPEAQLTTELSRVRGPAAGAALGRVYRRFRALPSRGQAAAPWSTGHLARREFDALYRDVAELCRTLGAELEPSPKA